MKLLPLLLLTFTAVAPAIAAGHAESKRDRSDEGGNGGGSNGEGRNGSGRGGGGRNDGGRNGGGSNGGGSNDDGRSGDGHKGAANNVNGTRANCAQQTLSIPVSTQALSFDVTKMQVTPDVINQTTIDGLFLQFVANSSAFVADYVNGSQTVAQTFSISGTLCTPSSGNTSNLQLLTHGIGTSDSYWSLQGAGLREKDYSYAYAAAAQGMATFRYDRLGVGRSSKPSDGYNVVQSAVELAILTGIATKLKQTTEIGNRTWNKVTAIGHSYGSALTLGLATTSADLIDGVILTGFSNDLTGFGPYLLAYHPTIASNSKDDHSRKFPRDDRSRKFPGHDRSRKSATTQYLLSPNKTAYATPLLLNGYYTKRALELAFDTQQPSTQGEYFTFATLVEPATNFTGPAHVVLPANDFLFAANGANGNQLATDSANYFFPASSNATGFTPANMGHDINFHVNATDVYAEMLGFIQSNGLA